MFEKIKEWIVKGVWKMLSKETVEQALKIKTAVTDEMDRAMQTALQVYTNNAGWLKKDVVSLQLGASISEEFARLTTLEMKSEVTGSLRADFIQEQYNKILEQLKDKLTLFNAVGGGFFKPYFNQRKIEIDFIPQTDCKPLKFNSAGNITSVVFTSQIAKGDKIYTRLETHTLHPENVYVVENKVYKTHKNSPSLLGVQANINEVEEWYNLSEQIVLQNVEKPLFAYYKVPNSNNIDTKSCLGISVFAKAIDSIAKADIQFSRLDYEYDSAKRKIYVDELATRKDTNTGKIVLADVVQKLNTGKEDFYNEFSPVVRDEAYIRGLNKIKQEIEFQCNLAYGTISDPTAVDKTATEIKTSKQRNYATVSQMQKSLENALKHLLYIIDTYITLYELAPTGEYEASFEWDDSIIVDAEAEQRISMQEVNAKLISKKRYLMRRYGLAQEQAEELLTEVEAENQNTNIFEE